MYNLGIFWGWAPGPLYVYDPRMLTALCTMEFYLRLIHSTDPKPMDLEGPLYDDFMNN